MHQHKKARLFLIFSANDAQRSTLGEKCVFSRMWSQIEMFPTGSPETLLFVKPGDGDLLETIRSAGARHILDVRDVPYLSIAGLDRSSFFEAMKELLVDYVGVHSLLHKTGSASFGELLNNQRTQHLLDEALVKKLASGPVLVMCDEDPEEDSKVGVLLDYLSKKNVKHRPVLAVH